jgi:hypothetical protein
VIGRIALGDILGDDGKVVIEDKKVMTAADGEKLKKAIK